MTRQPASLALAALVLGAASLACARGASPARGPEIATSDSAPPAEAVDRARAAANALGKDLQGRLLAALDSGGPARAVAFCADSAQAVTARHAREGVYVRRVSLRLRNPADRPDSVEERMLRYLDSLHRAGTLPAEIVRSARAADGTPIVAYARPIVVQARCLACHGDRAALAPAVRDMLAARYPADQATGYRVGDLRGMISVRVPR